MSVPLVIALDTDWPEDGKNAQSVGKPGNGGDAGRFFSIIGDLDLYVEQKSGYSGNSAGNYNGGQPGTPRNAIRFGNA